MLTDLIKRAEEIQNKQNDKLFDIKIERFEKMGIEGYIKIKRPDSALLTSFMERNQDSAYLLGECIVEPNLDDETLMRTYKANSKKNLVEKIFTNEEITDIDVIFGQIIKDNKSVSLVDKIADDIKN